MKHSLQPHERLEIVGLNHTNNGRMCDSHPVGCGRIIEVGSVCLLKKVELDFEYEEIRCPRKDVLDDLSKQQLVELHKMYGLKAHSKLSKKQLIDAILVQEGENLEDESESHVEIKTRREVAVAVSEKDTKCRVGFSGPKARMLIE
jgi:hypothetical protein